MEISILAKNLRIFEFWPLFWKQRDPIPLGSPSPADSKKWKMSGQIQKIRGQNWDFCVTAILAAGVISSWYYHFEDISIISGSFCEKIWRKQGHNIISKALSYCVSKKWETLTQQQNEISGLRIRAHYGRDIIVSLLWNISPSFLGVFARKFDGHEGRDILSKSLS